MERTILPILIMTNRQGAGKKKIIKNCGQPLIIHLLEKQASVKIFFEDKKKNEMEGKK